MQAAAVVFDALVEEGVLYLRCHALVAVVIHRIPGRRCYPRAAMQARCCSDPQNALVEEVVLSLRCHASSLLLDSQNALVQEGCAIPALSHASCCHDPQNALVEGCASLRCHASKLLS
jgi:hypothetical protein